MKFLIAFIAIALIALFAPQTESKKCKVSCDTYSTTHVCGKYGTRCMRFANTCKRKLYDCVHGVAYAAVDISRCANIALGTHGICATATTSAASLSYLNGLNGWSSLSGYSGVSPVTPIIIRV